MRSAGWNAPGKYEISYVNNPEVLLSNSADKDLILFRILQEILNNIIKHAQATKIFIGLDYTDQTLLLEVTDNGVGFDAINLLSRTAGYGFV